MSTSSSRVTTDNVRQHTGLTNRHIRLLITQGKLGRPKKVRGRFRISRKAADSFIAANPREQHYHRSRRPGGSRAA